MMQQLVSVAVLVLLSAASAHAQTLLTTDDGVSLHGTVRLLQANAATCNVIAENEQGNYEAKRANQDQPLHLWELEFSVFNGSGRALDHLVAYYDIASPWPPCTNWTEQFEGLGLYQWVDPSGRIQRTGDAMPTLPNETHSETIQVLAFNGVRPQFTDWSVNYTFMDGGAIASTATAAPASDPNVPCEGDPEGLKLTCLQIVPYGDDTVLEIPYMNGVIHGTEFYRSSDGSTEVETPYVNGVIHGIQVRRESNGVSETPFVNGERHGTQVYRGNDGYVQEQPFANGLAHGTQVKRYPDGRVVYNCWINNRISSTEPC